MKFSIEGDVLNIELSGMEKVWSLHGSFEIPLENIVSAQIDAPNAPEYMFRIPGTCLPGVFTAGSYYTKRDDVWAWEFWYYRHNKPMLVLELENERYKRIVLGTEDNSTLMSRINKAKK